MGVYIARGGEVMERTEWLQIRIDPETKQKLKMKAVAESKNVSEVIVDFIKLYVSDVEIGNDGMLRKIKK